jgi:ribosomal protein S27E
MNANPIRPLGFLRSFATTLGGGLVMAIIGGLFTPLLIGIPLLIAGVGAIIFSPVAFLFMRIASCPACGNDVVFMSHSKSKKCRHCKKRCIVVPTNNTLAIV